MTLCYLEVAENAGPCGGDEAQNYAGRVGLPMITEVLDLLETDRHHPKGWRRVAKVTEVRKPYCDNEIKNNSRQSNCSYLKTSRCCTPGRRGSFEEGMTHIC